MSTPTPYQPVNWAVSREDSALLVQIATRALHLYHGKGTRKPLRPLLMDLTACHANGTPLDLAAMLAAPDADFGHDVGGISRYIDRTTGKLTDCFVPRYAAREGQA